MRKHSLALGSRGFTLIELLVVIAIISILLAIAFPGYSAYTTRAARADAKGVLLSASSWMERYFNSNNGYAGAVLPASLSIAPTNSPASPKYNITFIAGQPTTTTYTLQAVPTGSDPTCGTLTIDQLGQKGATAAGNAAAVRDCWQR